MAFLFSLAAVLRLRELNEQREERLLTQILSQIVEARLALAAIEERIVATARSRESALESCLPAAELHDSYQFAALLKAQRQAAREQVRQFEQLRDRQIKIYQAANQGRELLTNMRGEQRERFLADRVRQEQKSLDDTFSARIRLR